eukprot:Clim_evm4s252 gene=Clim_evmTU4s252
MAPRQWLPLTTFAGLAMPMSTVSPPDPSQKFQGISASKGASTLDIERDELQAVQQRSNRRESNSQHTGPHAYTAESDTINLSAWAKRKRLSVPNPYGDGRFVLRTIQFSPGLRRPVLLDYGQPGVIRSVFDRDYLEYGSLVKESVEDVEKERSFNGPLSGEDGANRENGTEGQGMKDDGNDDDDGDDKHGLEEALVLDIEDSEPENQEIGVQMTGNLGGTRDIRELRDAYMAALGEDKGSDLSENVLIEQLKAGFIPEELIDTQFVYGGGKGGQAVNKTRNKVQLTFKPVSIVVYSHQHRSAFHNKREAYKKLVDKVREVYLGTSQTDAYQEAQRQRLSKQAQAAKSRSRREKRELAKQRYEREILVEQIQKRAADKNRYRREKVKDSFK